MRNTMSQRFTALGLLLVMLAGCGGGGGGGGDKGGGGAVNWTVTASAGSNGTITPDSIKVAHGATTVFTVTPASGFAIAAVTGCNGVLTGTAYTTDTITADCAVQASFTRGYSVGGTVSGLAWGSHVVLHNGNGDTVSVDANGPFTFPLQVVDGAGYDVTIATQPFGMHCTLNNASGSSTATAVTNVEVDCKDAVRAVYTEHGAGWNDYVVNDGANIWAASGAACSGDETGGHDACIHGGERRMLALSGVASCTGLTASDALDAFDWQCDGSHGYVRFVSSGLKPHKRLADLIDTTVPAWKENVVTVKNGDSVILVSALTRWWNNPVLVDNDGMTAAEMNVAGTVYVVNDNAQGKYEPGADRVALVVMPGKILRGPAAGSSAVSLAGRKFLWLEGDINAAQDNYGVHTNGLRFTVLRQMQVVNAAERALFMNLSDNNRLVQLMLSNNKGGIYCGTCVGNTLLGIVTAGGDSGIVLDHSRDNVVQNITSANNTQMGYFNANADYNYLAGAALVNHGGAGVHSYLSSNNSYVDNVSANNGTGVYMDWSNNNRHSGVLKLGNNATADCSVPSGTNPGLVTATCVNQGASDANLTLGVTLATAFAAKVMVDDAVTVTETNGAANYPADVAAFDWTRFEHALRSWGKDSGVFPAAENRGRWTSGVGRIWDWSAAAGDTVLKDVLAVPTGNDVYVHSWSDGTTTTALRHASELDGDGDGLCESGETCLHTPNIGAYQGHGALESAAAFTDGTITGVRLMKYQYNGR